MTTRTTTSRAIEVPDLVGDKADQAIQTLRQLGLIPVPWSAAVDDVKEAGFVLGLDPPPGSPVRPQKHITISVAAHPDFKGHADDAVAAEPAKMVQPPLTWPLSGPTGFAALSPREPGDASITAAAPAAPAAPASSSLDAATRDIQHDAGSSSAAEPTPGVAADPYDFDLSDPVPTPDEVSDDAEWDRLRAAEAERHAAGPASAPGLEAPPVESSPDIDVDPNAVHDTAEALEEKARRDARRRSARRHRRLTLKQKLIVAGVLALTLLIALSAMSGHKPAAAATAGAHTASHHTTHPPHKTDGGSRGRHKRAAHGRTVVHHKRSSAHKRSDLTAHHKARPHAARVPATASSSSHPSSSTPVVPVNAAPADTTPANTGAGAPATGTVPTAPASTSHKPASDPSSADSHSSGSGGASTLQSPDGTTAPPKP